MTEISHPAILFVDDNDDFRHIIAIGLKQYGYQVFTAHNTTSTLTKLTETGPGLHLIIIDHGLAGEDGIELGAQVLQQPSFQGFPLVLFTGTICDVLESRARSAGFADIWVKPVSFRSLHKKIQAILELLP